MKINPLTGRETLELVSEQRQTIYKGALVTAMQELHRCTETGEEFVDAEMGDKNIQAFKDNYNITKQFSDNQLTEYHNRLKEVLETTGQLREEDLGYCLGLVSEDALDQVKQKESNDEA